MASSTVTPVPDPSYQSQPEDVEKTEAPLVLPESDASSTRRDPLDSTAVTSSDPITTTTVVDSTPPSAAMVEPTEPAEPSDAPGTNTTIRENRPPSLTSQVQDAAAPQPAPTASNNIEPPQQQTQSAAHSTSETEETKQCDPAIGPSSELSSPMSKEMEDSGMVLNIDLLLITGARHPFTINGKYLRKRQVDVPDFNPYAMSVYTLKELIWREWRSEWEPRPSSPSSIRLISFGKLLTDNAQLSDLRLNQNAPNVVHMTIKPQEVVDEEDAKAARSTSGRERDGGDHTPRCRCVIL
ncbi:hypothetical protein ACJ73_00866 [Blastomyces percursus]|uniref:UBL3-like ubiquitin domain-containing protein n=1 Tax=Blastomyces percursus TaxID=1658174 RepID=A0A1J9RGQ0_9EURO|nr:hypothetical protein ACJ73_00866 [Blastomyces percursus]